MKTKYKVLLKEDLDFKTKSHWSKAGQYNKIKKILAEYPTAKEFKAAVMKTGDEKAISLVKNLDDNASRSDYVDFLQYSFNKYSKVGKYLLSGLVGLGTGAALSYLTGKAKEKELPEAPNKAWSAIKGAVGGGVSGGVAGRTIGGIADTIRNGSDPNVNSDLSTKLAVIGGSLGTIGGGIGGWYSAKKAAEDRANEILKAKLIAGGIGAGVGGLGAHRIQSWREKHLQDKIDALKGYN